MFKAADKVMTQEVMLCSENVLQVVIFQTYGVSGGVSSHHDGHSYVCSMGLSLVSATYCLLQLLEEIR